jgi:hypothetical protein
MGGFGMNIACDKKPKCKLTGKDGNVFNIIGLVQRALKDAGKVDEAKDFVAKAFAAESYDEVLYLATEVCDVE